MKKLALVSSNIKTVKLKFGCFLPFDENAEEFESSILESVESACCDMFDSYEDLEVDFVDDDIDADYDYVISVNVSKCKIVLDSDSDDTIFPNEDYSEYVDKFIRDRISSVAADCGLDMIHCGYYMSKYTEMEYEYFSNPEQDYEENIDIRVDKFFM